MIFFNFDIFDSRKNNRDIYVPGTYTQSLGGNLRRHQNHKLNEENNRSDIDFSLDKLQKSYQ